jgi:hypothetical protein
MGYYAGRSNTTGYNNLFLGNQAGESNQTGFGNVYLGYLAGTTATGYNNTFVGSGAGQAMTTGNYNTFIGMNAGYSATTGTDNVFIGNTAGYSETGSGKLYIDNSSTTLPLIHGDFVSNILRINGNIEYTGTITDVSDSRLKDNIVELDNALSKLITLRGVYYDWKEDVSDVVLSGGRQIGIIAQEVEAVFPELVITNEQGYKMVDYTRLAPILIEGVKTLDSRLSFVEKENQSLKLQNELLAKEVDELKSLKSRMELLESIILKTGQK